MTKATNPSKIKKLSQNQIKDPLPIINKLQKLQQSIHFFKNIYDFVNIENNFVFILRKSQSLKGNIEARVVSEKKPAKSRYTTLEVEIE